MSLTNFTAADFAKENGIKRADSVKNRRKAPVTREPEPTSQPIDKTVKDENEVPSGTVPEILGWVGEDKEKAQKALEVEQKDSKPRKGLVSALEDLLGIEDDVPAEPVEADDAEKPVEADEDEILSSDDAEKD